VQDLKKEIGNFHARVFVDSAPVMEKDWAKRSGTGWIGKNTLLINPKKGSYFFLAEIILDVEFEYDHPIRDHCGTCTRCIDACPTDAISPQGYVLDGSKCISYLTIELRSQIPEEFTGKMKDWIFGCDICQEVCPWNRFSSPHKEQAFVISDELKNMTARGWEELTDEVFLKLFENSPVKRTGYEGLVRNIRFAARKNS
jgi:epoxyqueuosine reductase